MNENTVLQVEGVRYSYAPATEEEKPTLALRDVNVSVRAGEFIAVLGHNGSGKSTLAKLMNAQILPDAGRVLVLGKDTSSKADLWDIRARCGMVFQNPDNQMVAAIVEEDVAFGPENLGIPNPELRQRVDASLEAVGMLQYARREPHALSGGQKQRVAIAGVLAMQPDCVILDEPTAMLDPIGRRQVMQSIHFLQDAGKTVVLITHYMDEAVQADRVVVFSQGTIVLSGTPREVFTQVEKLRALALDVPQAAEIAWRLRKDGFRAPEGALTVEELLEGLQ